MRWLRQQEGLAPLSIAKATIAIEVRRVPKTRRKGHSFPSVFCGLSIYELGKKHKSEATKLSGDVVIVLL
jgi:hypothetical protein